MSERKLRIGVAGLGRAFTIMLPTFTGDPRVRLLAAASQGKHVLVEKPMAIALADCTAMIAAARNAGVHLIVGHSHSFNAPIRRTAEIIASGEVGAVRMITA